MQYNPNPACLSLPRLDQCMTASPRFFASHANLNRRTPPNRLFYFPQLLCALLVISPIVSADWMITRPRGRPMRWR